MIPRPLAFGLALGLALLPTEPAAAAPLADDADVQRLGQPRALRQLANKGPAATRQFLLQIAARYQQEGYTVLGNRLQQANATLSLFADRDGRASGRTLQAARAELRALKANLRGTPRVVLPDANETRAPHFWNLALTFTDLGNQVVANAARRSGTTLTAFTMPLRETWVERLSSVASSGVSLAGAGTLQLTGGMTYVGWNGTTTVGSLGILGTGGNLAVSSAAVTFNTGSWLLFDPATLVPDELSGQKTITWVKDYLVNGTLVGSGGKLVSVTEGTVAPDGATEPTLPITLSPAPSPTPTPAE